MSTCVVNVIYSKKLYCFFEISKASFCIFLWIRLWLERMAFSRHIVSCGVNQSRSIDLRKGSSLTVLFRCEIGSFSCVWFVALDLVRFIWSSASFRWCEFVKKSDKYIRFRQLAQDINDDLFRAIHFALAHTHETHILVVDSRQSTHQINQIEMKTVTELSQTKVDCFIWQVNMLMKQCEKRVVAAKYPPTVYLKSNEMKRIE